VSTNPLLQSVAMTWES